jgi:hypothetical protein
MTFSLHLILQILLVFHHLSLLPKNLKIIMHKSAMLIFINTDVNFGLLPKGKNTEDVWEQGAGENIWT